MNHKTHAAQDARREHLIALMGRHRISCEELAAMVDRKPQTVRCWRSGNSPIADHSLALVELVLRMRRAA